MLSERIASENAIANHSPMQLDKNEDGLVLRERNINLEDHKDEMKEAVSVLIQSGYGWILNDGKHCIDDVDHLVYLMSSKENSLSLLNQYPSSVDDDSANIQPIVARKTRNEAENYAHIEQQALREGKPLFPEQSSSDIALRQMMREKATIIQKHYRRFAREKVYKSNMASIILIQNRHRQRNATTKLRKLKLAVTMQSLVLQAAITIQTRWRTYKCESLYFGIKNHRLEHAKRIQACTRAFLIRKKYQLTQHDRSELSDIILVQSIYRQKKAKRRLDHLKLVSTLHLIIVQSAVLIQKQWRLFDCRRNYSEYRSYLSNVIIIQNIWRQRQAKKRCDKLKLSSNMHHSVLRRSAICIQRKWRSSCCDAENIRIQRYPSDLSKIILVQSLYRQRKAKAQMSKLKLLFTMQEVVIEAASKIQKQWRSFHVENNLRRGRRQSDLSKIILVQSLFRQGMAKRKTNKLKLIFLMQEVVTQSAVLIQKNWRSFYSQKNYVHLLASANVIQNQFRKRRNERNTPKSERIQLDRQASGKFREEKRKAKNHAKMLLEEIQLISPETYQHLTDKDCSRKCEKNYGNPENATPFDFMHLADQRDEIEANDSGMSSNVGRRALPVGNTGSTFNATEFKLPSRNVTETSHTSHNKSPLNKSELRDAFSGIVKSYATTNLHALIDDTGEDFDIDVKCVSPHKQHNRKSKAKERAKTLLTRLQSLSPEVYQLLTTENMLDAERSVDGEKS